MTLSNFFVYNLLNERPTAATEKVLQLTCQLDCILKTSERLTSSMHTSGTTSPIMNEFTSNHGLLESFDYPESCRQYSNQTGESHDQLTKDYSHCSPNSLLSGESSQMAMIQNHLTRELEEINVELASMLEKCNRAYECPTVKMNLMKDQYERRLTDLNSECTNLQNISHKDLKKTKEQNSLHHYDFWTLNNSLHSPWPSIEVDQLANWLIEMKSMILKKSPIFQKSVCTLSYSFSSNSSSSSCCSSCSSCSCSSSCSSSSSSSSEVFGPNEEQLSGKGNKRSKCCLHHLRYKHKLQNQQKMITLSKLKMNPEHFVIIDCRYPHEYNAGHIFSAINLSDWPKLYKYFFGIKQQSIETTEMDLSNSLYSTEQLIEPKPSHTIFILYCEFSTKRAPQLFYLLRNHDRLLHFNSYPALKYPFVYILHGGYSTFYKKYPYLCEPDLLSIWHKHCKLVNRQTMNPNSQDETSKPFSCSICHRGFRQSRSLENHKRSNHPIKKDETATKFNDNHSTRLIYTTANIIPINDMNTTTTTTTPNNNDNNNNSTSTSMNIFTTNCDVVNIIRNNKTV
ncbi:hypothetical protein MS3_00010021 [Schistosoma haematobium]|uniref:Uncharacterized protein n=2 Tax=Schistosoma TaxID=6181 RepID=A0A922LTG7_SCHHA|nr:hypothetical protein MS3_00010021 [Schistosoma haematobium]KAH9593681.1 hypothetical protein MS3_00010021 [Schistosoma haematobium]